MSMQDSIYADTDDFAQTRGADDLFESEIQPITPSVPSPPPNAPTGPRAHRGRGGRHDTSRHVAPQPKLVNNVEASSDQPQQETTEPTTEAQTSPPEKKAAPVNRLLSGGIRKPKLTEDELAARMEKVKLNNKRLTERRRKAEEDENSFQESEAARKQLDAQQRLIDRKKQMEAEKNRRELNEERERNRQRKLKAVQNREWDSEKKEEDYNPSNLPRYRRGAHGAVVGGHASGNQSSPAKPAAPEKTAIPTKAPTEWPALPGQANEDKKDTPTKASTAQDMNIEIPAMQGSWADQVEDSSPTK